MRTPPPSPAARLRAIKRHVWLTPQRFLATCAPGLEDLLLTEVARLPGVALGERRTGAVAFSAPFDTVYAALLRLALAESLRWVVWSDAAATTSAMLFDQLGRARWPLWLPDESALTVRVRTSKSRLRDDAQLERTLRQALRAQGIETEADAPPMTAHLHLHHDRATVSLDAGGPLHRRRGDKWVSPTTIRETTAAALVRASGVLDPLDPPDLVCDPFCGSGTLAIETLEAWADAAPGRWLAAPLAASPSWKPERWAHARRTLGGEGHVPPEPPFLASDADRDAVTAARHNLERAGYGARARVAVARAQDLDLPALARTNGAQRPLLLANPPYGKEAAALGAPPRDLLRRLLSGARGWRFALLYPRPEDLDDLPGIELREVRTIVTGGLRNAILVGSVAGTRA